MLEPKPEILKSGIDPTGAWIDFRYRSSLDDRPGKKRRSHLHRVAIEQVEPASQQDLGPSPNAESLSQPRICIDRLHLQDLHLGEAPSCLGIRQEGCFASFSMPTSEAIVAKSTNWRTLPSKGPAAAFRHHQPLVPEEGNRLADGPSCRVVPITQFTFGRQRRARHDYATFDVRAEVVGNLPVGGSVARWIELKGHQESGYARILVYTSHPFKDTILNLERKHWVSVAAAVVDGERVLAIRRRDNNKWEPPGGTLEPDETIIEGLRREVLEEIGIRLSEPTLSGVYKNMNRGIVALVYRSIHNGDSPKQSDEVAESRWMTAKEIEENLDPAYAARLLDALSNGAPATRAHDGIRLLDSPNDPRPAG